MKGKLPGSGWVNHALITHHTNFLARSVAAILLGAVLVASPALAKNGKGGGAGNGHEDSKNADNSAQDASASDASTSKAKSAGSLGALNGFMHASPKALAHASAKSEIGRVAVVYGGLLQNYLSPQQGTTPHRPAGAGESASISTVDMIAEAALVSAKSCP
jgi:hypothetical protein